MARLDLEEFAERELARVYIAGRVNEADRVESALTRQGLDYAVEIEPYLKRVLGIFTSKYSGVAFYVPSGQAAFARSALLAEGLTQGIADEPSSAPPEQR
jgi:hypothetical protein